MKIELFTEVNFRGPTAKNGKCIALVECETKKGPAAVHNNAKNARILMAKAQEVYERTHTREEWMKNAGKNYL